MVYDVDDISIWKTVRNKHGVCVALKAETPLGLCFYCVGKNSRNHNEGMEKKSTKRRKKNANKNRFWRSNEQSDRDTAKFMFHKRECMAFNVNENVRVVDI